MKDVAKQFSLTAALSSVMNNAGTGLHWRIYIITKSRCSSPYFNLNKKQPNAAPLGLFWFCQLLTARDILITLWGFFSSLIQLQTLGLVCPCVGDVFILLHPKAGGTTDGAAWHGVTHQSWAFQATTEIPQNSWVSGMSTYKKDERKRENPHIYPHRLVIS